MRKAALLLLGLCSLPALALTPSAPPQPAIRYHYGDNPRWADRNFDDSAWPIAPNGQWPLPSFDSDGFVWVRVHLAVPARAGDPLALQMQTLASLSGSDQVFVNGVLVVSQGAFPPHPAPWRLPFYIVSDLPPGLAAPGTVATVAMRVWQVPAASRPGLFGAVVLKIGDAANLRLAERAFHEEFVLASMPDMALNGLLALVGIGLLIFWRWSKRRELLWCGALLISYPIFECFYIATDIGYLFIPLRSWTLLRVLFMFPTMATTVGFIWAVHDLRAPVFRRLAHASWMVFNLATLVVEVANHPSHLVRWSGIVLVVAVQLFNCITFAANFWALFVLRKNRAIAAMMMIIPVASALGYIGLPVHRTMGLANMDLFDVGFLLAGFAIAAMLVQRAVNAWREGNELRFEFAAAQEIQRQLVTVAQKIPGFAIDTVYAPAREVGGDFFRVLPGTDGGVLLVVGDVSGKGLRAAMTVSSIMGALRTIPSQTPAVILDCLNRSLAGHLSGGFATCCAACISTDGRMTIANAGHLSPYRNGQEIQSDSGLPLGITAIAEYTETKLQLDPGDTLTFLSDGVVEAQNERGELFGFDRTAAISTQSAEAIAAAAQAFGQEDDITVLTLTFAPVEVLHA